MDQYVQGTLTILSLVKPVICGTMFSKIAVDKPSAARIFFGNARLRDHRRHSVSCSSVGDGQLLQVFGISLGAFQATLCRSGWG